MPARRRPVAALQGGGAHRRNGGDTGDPPLHPLIDDTDAPDIPIVGIDPVESRDVPVTARAIVGRVDTPGIRSSLMRGMRAVHFVAGPNDIGKNFLRPRSADGLKPGLKPPPRLPRHGGTGRRDASVLPHRQRGGRP